MPSAPRVAPVLVQKSRVPLPQSRPSAPPAEPPGLPEDGELFEPIPVESSGMFQKLYDTWVGEPKDSAATADAERFFQSAFSTYDIHPESTFVGCGTSLCRSRFRFADLKELYKMNQIDQADGVKIATTFPLDEGGDQTVSIYWTRNPHPEGSLTETAGQ